MERKPEDFAKDPFLRPPFCEQVSLDEFTLFFMSHLSDDTDPIRDELREKLLAMEVKEQQQELLPIWLSRLDPDTNVVELLYLQGVTDKAARLARLDQQHPELREAAKRAGWF